MNRYLLLASCALLLLIVANPASAEAASENPATEKTPDPATGRPQGCTLCPEMARLPGGEFVMGSGNDDPDAGSNEKPRRKVQVKPFSLGRFEVTRGQFGDFVRESGYKASQPGRCFVWGGSGWTEKTDASWHDPGFPQGDNHPVVCVSYDDVQAYIRWLNLKTGQKYRLPTEAEWEYAARAETTGIRHWGNQAQGACQYANVGDQATRQAFPGWNIHPCMDGHIYTSPVGRFESNGFQLHDMHGNVWEWTCSVYTGGGYDGNENTCQSATRARRTVRGGAWSTDPQDVRAAYRSGDDPGNRFYNLGFRLALD